MTELPADVLDAEEVEEEEEERRTTAVELLWDLVFVFAITQVTTLLANRTTWTRFGEAMLVLALIWWAWSAFVWAANAQSAESPTLRAVLLAATILIFITGLAVPRAFGSESTLFAVSYTLVRLLHLALYVDASRRGNASWSAIAGFGVTVLIGMALLIVGSLFTGPVRAVAWTAALAIDYAGPAWLTRERLRGLQHVAVAHFAERYGLFVIICLGESIATIGVGAAHEDLRAALLASVAFGLIATVAMWWTYFEQSAAGAEERLRAHDDPVLAAADAYSYIHLLLVAGIIIFAVGMRFVVRTPSASLAVAPRLTLCGGVALYLIGHAAFEARMGGRVGYEKPLGAVLLLALAAAGSSLAAWLISGLVAALLVGVCLAESRAGA